MRSLLLVTLLAASVSPDPTPVTPAEGLPPLACLDDRGVPLPESIGARERQGQAVARPEPLTRVAPKFPRKARGCRGPKPIGVDVEALVTTEGRVCAARVVSRLAPSCLPYGEAAIEAVKQWVFKPAVADGQSVPYDFVLTIQFVNTPPVVYERGYE
jgi:hypothetical protein